MSSTVARIGSSVCLCLASVAGAAAQDDRSVGLTIGYPSSVGVIWQAADRVAIRTDTSFSSSWTDADTPNAETGLLQLIAPSTSTSGHTVGVGVSVLVTVARWDRVRAYVAPRAAYLRSSSTTEFKLPAGIPGLPGLPGLPIRIQSATYETKTRTQTYSGSFGTQYRLADRFAAFGEVGVAYASSRTPATTALVFGSGGSTSAIFSSLGLESSFSVSPPRPRSNSLGIRSGVGVVFFF